MRSKSEKIKEILLPRESVAFAMEQHPVAYVSPFILLLIGILLSVELPIDYSKIDPKIGQNLHLYLSTAKEYFFGIIFILAGISGFYKTRVSSKNIRAITNLRVIVTKGSFGAKYIEASLAEVKKINIKSNLLFKLVFVGKLQFIDKNKEILIEIPYVHDAKKNREKIINIIKNYHRDIK